MFRNRSKPVRNAAIDNYDRYCELSETISLAQRIIDNMPETVSPVDATFYSQAQARIEVLQPELDEITKKYPGFAHRYATRKNQISI